MAIENRMDFWGMAVTDATGQRIHDAYRVAEQIRATAHTTHSSGSRIGAGLVWLAGWVLSRI